MSNQYRLIKEYPGSPKLGTVVIVDKTKHSYYSTYPEFWEKVVDKDYKILLLKSRRTGNISSFNWLAMGAVDWDIISIKRLSDNEVFSVGDKVFWDLNSCDYEYFTIKSLEVKQEGGLYMNTVEKSVQNFHLDFKFSETDFLLNRLQHYKPSTLPEKKV